MNTLHTGAANMGAYGKLAMETGSALKTSLSPGAREATAALKGMTDQNLKKYMDEFATAAEKGDEALVGFKNQDFPIPGMQEFFETADAGSASVDDLTNHLTKMHGGLDLASMGTSLLQGALGGLAMVGVSLVIQGITTAINDYVHANEIAIQGANELKEAHAAQKQENEANLSSLQDMQSEYATLAQGVDEYGGNVSLTADEYARYQSIVDQVVGMYPQLLKGYDDENNALVEKNSLIEDAIGLQKQMNDLAQLEYFSDLPELIKGTLAELEEAVEEFNKGKVFDSTSNDAVSAYFTALDQENPYRISSYLDENYGVNLNTTQRQVQTGTDANNRPTYDTYYTYSFPDEESFREFWENHKEILEQMVEDDIISAQAKVDIEARMNILEVEDGTRKLLEDQLTNYLNLSASTYDWYSEIDSDNLSVFRDAVSSLDYVGKSEKQLLSDTYALGEAFAQIQGDLPTQEMDNLTERFLSGAISQEEYSNGVAECTARIDVIKEELGDTNENLSGFLDQLGNGYEEFGLLNEVLEDEKFSDVRSELERLALNGELTPETLTSDYKELAEALEEAGLDAQTAASRMSELFGAGVNLDDTAAQLIAGHADAIENYAQKLELLEQAQAEISANGDVSFATLQALQDNGLDDTLQYTADGVMVVTDKLRDQYLAYMDTNEAALQTAAATDIYRDALNKAKAGGGEFTATSKEIEAALQSAAKEAENAEDFVKKFNASLGDKTINLSDTELRQLLGTYQTTASAIGVATANQDNWTSSLRNASAAVSDTSNSLNSLQDSENAINALLDMTVSMLKQTYTTQRDGVQKNLNALTESYNTQKQQISDAYNASKKSIDNQKKDLQALNKQKQKQFETQKEQENELYAKQKERYEAEKKAINDSLSAYREKINLQLKLLEAQEDERSYEKELAKRQKTVADIEAQLLALQFDNSEAANKKRRELEEQLASAREDLEEYQYQHSVELQKQALNEALEAYEAQQERKLELLDEQFEKETAQHETRLARIEAESERWQDSYERQSEALDARAEKLSAQNETQLAAIEAEYNTKKKKMDEELQRYNDLISNESALRKQAMDRIENDADNLYKELVEWNEEYGDGVELHVLETWNEAVDALNEFSNGKKSVKDALDEIARRMYNLKTNAEDAANAINGIPEKNVWLTQTSATSTPSANLKSPSQISGKHTGGVIRRHEGIPTGVQDELLMKVKVGETVLSPNSPQRAMLLINDFIAKHVPFGTSLAAAPDGSVPSTSPSVSGRSVGTPYQREWQAAPAASGQVVIDTLLNIEGNVDESILPELRREIQDIPDQLLNRIIRTHMVKGAGLNAKNRSI